MTVADPDELRRVAERVLEGSEFREPEPSLVQRVLDAIGDLLGELLEGVGDGGAGTFIGVALVAASIGALVWLVVRLVPDVRAARLGAAGGGTRHRPTVEVAEQRSPDSWDDEAAGHEAAGRWDEALRARYRAVVARLARRGAVRDAPDATTGEHRSGVDRDDRRAPVDAGAFASSADRFDEVWYGGSSASPDDVDRARRLAEEVDGAR
ncbi:MAG: DUF4129 domain-containing protein [Actinomycetota bacterium]